MDPGVPELNAPEFNALPPEQRDAVLRACRESEQYQALGRRQAPRVMVIGGIVTLAIVGVLVFRHDISLGTAVIITWACFLLCIPPVRMWNRAQQRRLLDKLVAEHLRGASAATTTAPAGPAEKDHSAIG
jgi:hypothetical protein